MVILCNLYLFSLRNRTSQVLYFLASLHFVQILVLFFYDIYYSAKTVANRNVRLRDGVIRDIERQNRKKENIRLLGEQILLTEQLEAEREKMVLAKGSQET
ncbi:hypothetical protein FD755_004483 [Muntiacus reevesi]|uniref:Protein PET117 homolog, mitochondrial n=1 Tax=Muntiacus reevesi TaxID=9886 RepID=A0A5J5MT59_MUNRE|nr:hypothetical protein FD755_004483 [Muntiacus reevesi]